MDPQFLMNAGGDRDAVRARPSPDGGPGPDAAATTPYRDYRLSSHYQPIYSLTHRRVVGHEALLRATANATGAPVSPLVLFEQCNGEPEALLRLDRAAMLQHLRGYAAGSLPQWLFINVHPKSLAAPGFPDMTAVARALDAWGLRPEQIVIEVLESSLPDDSGFDSRIEALRALGCLVSLDDFGAGHSNFDRVFSLRPEIVKLDRSVVVRAEVDAHARRIASQMVSLLHECGCLVLMEGIETPEGAYTALRCDVDFVQGYHFARPGPMQAEPGIGLHALKAAWDRFDLMSATDDRAWQQRMAPYRQAIELASVLLAGGAGLEDACRRFLSQPGALMCYLLDKSGLQVVPNAYAPGRTHVALDRVARFAPLHDTLEARWARRPYFRRASAAPHVAQVTRPYMTLQGDSMCVTVSIQFEMGGRSMVLCGDASP